VDKHKHFLNKDVGVASAIGAGLGALHGSKNNNVVGSVLLGAGIGALVGLLGKSLNTTKETEERLPVQAEKE